MDYNDPRWAKISAYFDWLEENHPVDENADEYTARWGEFVETLEKIAADPSVPAHERSTAQEQLVEIKAECKMLTPTVIEALMRVASDENADPDMRAEARTRLAQLAEQMRAQGTDISQWVGVSERLQ